MSQPIPFTPNSALLTEMQASLFLGVPQRTLQAWRLRGGGPQFVKLGRLVRYRQRDLEAWLDCNTFIHTSAVEG